MVCSWREVATLPRKNSDHDKYSFPGRLERFCAFRDMAIPPRGTTARVGGRLLQGSEGATSKAIEKLHDVIAAEVDTALGNADLSSFSAESMDHVLKVLAQSINESKPYSPSAARLVPIGFASNDASH